MAVQYCMAVQVLLRHSHSAYADLNSDAIDNNDANENDSCYYLGPGEGYCSCVCL